MVHNELRIKERGRNDENEENDHRNENNSGLELLSLLGTYQELNNHVKLRADQYKIQYRVVACTEPLDKLDMTCDLTLSFRRKVIAIDVCQNLGQHNFEGE